MSFILFSSTNNLPVVCKQCDSKTYDIIHGYLQNILSKSNSSPASSHIQVSDGKLKIFIIIAILSEVKKLNLKLLLYFRLLQGKNGNLTRNVAGVKSRQHIDLVVLS